jgi:phenylacetate-CoA ligase
MQDHTPAPGDLDPIERASADELQALQLDRLRWTLRHAYANVPHYRAAFDAVGVHPEDCHDLADLAKYPLTSKADLRENYPFGMFAVPREQVVRVHASSGTTGRATVVGYTRPRAAVPATSCTMPTGTGCSPAAWARTTARRSSAARWSRSPAA